jgi:hypothetical protein
MIPILLYLVQDDMMDIMGLGILGIDSQIINRYLTYILSIVYTIPCEVFV